MSQFSEFARVDEIVRSRREEAKKIWKLPLLAALPFLPAWILAFAGFFGGFYAAYKRHQAEAQELPRTMHPRYRSIPLKDGQLAQHLYLGHAVDIREYKHKYLKFSNEHGVIDEKKAEEFELSMLGRMQPLHLIDDMLTRHMFVGGSTGIGKTELYLSVLYQQIARGGGGILFDAKGDEKTFSRVYAMMKMFNREHDLYYMNFDRPKISHTYNPLLHGNTRQLISALMKLVGDNQKTQEFFKRLNREGIAAMVECLRAQPTAVRFNFKDLAALLTDFKYFQELFSNIPQERRNQCEFVYMFLKNFIQRDAKSGEYFVNDGRYKELMQGLKGTMMDFSHSEYAHLLNDYNPDIDILDAILNNKVIIITVPALSDREGAQLFGRLFLADFARAVSEINNMRIRNLVTFLVLLDEYGSIADPSHIELLQQARSANVSMWLSVQGRGFLDAVNSPFFADNMLTNCWNHIYLDVRDPKTREAAAKLAGTAMVQFRRETFGTSFGATHSSGVTGAIREENSGQNVSIGTNEMREEILQPEDFSMKEGEAIFVGKFANMRLRLPMVHFDERFVPEIEDIQLPRVTKNPSLGLNLASRAFRDGKNVILSANG